MISRWDVEPVSLTRLGEDFQRFELERERAEKARREREASTPETTEVCS